MTQTPSAIDVLEEIKRFEPARRFLQSWDTATGILRYGCGDGKNAIVVGSDVSLSVSHVRHGTKLQTATIKKFLRGQASDNPFDAVKTLLRSHLYLADSCFVDLFTLWIASTYAYSLFSHFGYLFLFSHQARCGKTRAEEIVSLLAFEATEPRNAPTPPSMRETALHGGTAIFDTLERWKSKESFGAAMEILDVGFRNGGVVQKMVPIDGGGWQNDVFPVYAPYMFAAIGRESLSETALDRAFQVEMVRKSTKVRTKPIDEECRTACEALREALYLFFLTNASQIAQVYKSQELRDRVDGLGLNDRAVDIWKPLFAVAKVMAPGAFGALSPLAIKMSSDEDRQEESRQLRILSALRGLIGQGANLQDTTQRLIGQLQVVSTDEVADLHQLLSEWGFNEKSIRLFGLDSPRRAWEITDAQLAGVEARLRGEGIPPEQAATTTTNQGASRVDDRERL